MDIEQLDKFTDFLSWLKKDKNKKLHPKEKETF